jgi:hypothetical protein
VKIFESICLAAITACLAFLVIELGLLSRDARKDLDALSKNLNTLTLTANQTAVEARDASEQAKLAAIEQRAYWSKTSLETYKTMASLRLTIVRTNHSLNDEISPRLAMALDSTNRLTATAAEQLQKTMDELQPTLANLGRASAGAADAMNDPAIHETLAHVDEISQKTAVTADQAAQATAHVNTALADIAAYVHRMTAPARGIWTFAKELLGLAAQARQAGGI